jgi:uncharacterized protein (DUF2252 family)
MIRPGLRLSGFLIFGLLTAAPSPSLKPAPGWKAETGTARRAVLQDALAKVDGGLTPEIRKAKDEAMAESPFTFFRGTAYLFHRDLASQKLLEASPFNKPETATWVQGDLHVQNLGAFDDDRETVVYDLNDFDEAWVASYLRDLWRAAVSIVLVSRSAHRTPEDAGAAVDAFTGGYLETLESYRGNDHEKQAEMTVAEAQPPLKEFLADVARKNSRKKMIGKWTVAGAKGPVFNTGTEDLAPATADERKAVTAAIADYEGHLSSGLVGKAGYFTVLDVARRLNAGTGSLGTPRFYVLIEGAGPGADDDRILDVKRQGLPSVHANLSGAENETQILARYPKEDSQGCRVAAAQKALLTRVDDHLGCLSMLGGSWSVRERSPFKKDLEKDLDAIAAKPADWRSLARQWGKILATDHARANLDDRSVPFPGKFKDTVLRLTQGRRDDFAAEVRRFALAYADQVASDHKVFLDLRTSRTIP